MKRFFTLLLCLLAVPVVGAFHGNPHTTNTFTPPSLFDTPTTLVLSGDSETFGYPGIGLTKPWPWWVTNVWASTENIVGSPNVAVGGAESIDTWDGFVANIKPWARDFSTTGTNSELTIWVGINDIHNGTNAALISMNISNLVYAAHSNGMAVTLFNIPPLNYFTDDYIDDFGDYSINTNRLALNDYLLNNIDWDYFVDVAKLLGSIEANCGAPPCTANHTIEGIHFDHEAMNMIAEEYVRVRTGEKRKMNKPPQTLYVATIGDDKTGRPYRTVEAANAAAKKGDIIQISTGYYTNTAMIRLKDGVSLRGAGAEQTFICYTVPSTEGAVITLTNDNSLADLTVFALNVPNLEGEIAGNNLFYPIQTSEIGATNVFLYNVNTLGWSDGIVTRNYAPNFRAVNCYFHSGWDQVANYLPDDGYTGIMTFDSCRFWADGNYMGGYTNMRNINVVYGELTFNHCSFRVTGGDKCVLANVAAAGPGLLTFNDCSMVLDGSFTEGYYSTNALYKSTNVVYNGVYDIAKVKGPATYNGTGFIGDICNTNAVPGTNFAQNVLSGRFVVSSGQLAAVLTNSFVTTNSIIGAAITDLTTGTNHLRWQAGSGLIRFEMPVVGASDTAISWWLIKP